MTSTPTNLTRVPDPEVPARASRRTYTAHYKAQILAEYDSLDAAGRGALLRRHGLYTSHITNWRKVDRKSTRLKSSHSQISYAVFCLKKKKKTNEKHLI